MRVLRLFLLIVVINVIAWNGLFYIADLYAPKNMPNVFFLPVALGVFASMLMFGVHGGGGVWGAVVAVSVNTIFYFLLALLVRYLLHRRAAAVHA
jgi:hypothetical protein